MIFVFTRRSEYGARAGRWTISWVGGSVARYGTMSLGRVASFYLKYGRSSSKDREHSLFGSSRRNR